MTLLTTILETYFLKLCMQMSQTKNILHSKLCRENEVNMHKQNSNIEVVKMIRTKIVKSELEENNMIIKRTFEDKEYEIELSDTELYQAKVEYTTNWMKSVLTNDFGIDDESLADELAVTAYDLYCEGDGYTEYECVEKVYDDFSRNN